MSDLANRLRDEAHCLPPPACDKLVQRITATLPPTATASTVRARSWRIPLAAAACLAMGGAGAWWFTVAPAGSESHVPQVATAPTIPAVGALVEAASLAVVEVPAADELAALGADLASIARTVRGSMPF